VKLAETLYGVGEFVYAGVFSALPMADFDL
jgi:hypothetical protein